MNSNLSKKERKKIDDNNSDLKNIKNIKEKEEKKKISLDEIEESFYQYKKRVNILILAYILLYTFWCIIGHIKELAKLSAIGFLQNNKLFLHWFLLIFTNIIIGLLFCLDGKICAWIKTPFARLTLGIGMSNLTKEKKQSLLFKATDANETIRETFKKFGVITIIAELQNFFFLGKTLGEFLRDKNGCATTIAGGVKGKNEGDEIKSYGYFCFLIAYLIPIALSLYYMQKIKNSLDELKKEEKKRIKRA